MATRFVIIDDLNDRISYDGSWFTDWRNQDYTTENGFMGPPYGNTLHGTNTSSSFSLSFSGTSVHVYGPNRRSSGNPEWECSVDQVKFGMNRDGDPLVSCYQAALEDGPHILTVNVTAASKDVPFYIDRIQYTPTRVARLENETIYIEGSDESIVYEKNWAFLSGLGNATNTNGASFEIEFIGVSLDWYGFANHSESANGTSASYTLDDQPPELLKLPTSIDRGKVYRNQIQFQTEALPMGKHRFAVAYNGDSESMIPLTLSHFIVRNGTFPTLNTPQPAKKMHVAYVVISIALPIIAIVMAVVFIRRRRWQLRQSWRPPSLDLGSEGSQQVPSTLQTPIQPFQHPKVSQLNGRPLRPLPTIPTSCHPQLHIKTDLSRTGMVIQNADSLLSQSRLHPLRRAPSSKHSGVTQTSSSESLPPYRPSCHNGT